MHSQNLTGRSWIYIFWRPYLCFTIHGFLSSQWILISDWIYSKFMGYLESVDPDVIAQKDLT